MLIPNFNEIGQELGIKAIQTRRYPKKAEEVTRSSWILFLVVFSSNTTLISNFREIGQKLGIKAIKHEDTRRKPKEWTDRVEIGQKLGIAPIQNC